MKSEAPFSSKTIESPNIPHHVLDSLKLWTQPRCTVFVRS